MKPKTAILDVEGADCPSCVYAIEHFGRKVEGIHSVRVNTVSREITVEYAGNAGSLERIAGIVRQLGYGASIRWDSLTVAEDGPAVAEDGPAVAEDGPAVAEDGPAVAEDLEE